MTNNEIFFSDNNPIFLFKKWLKDAEKKELNDPNAIALATVDSSGLPNVRMVLLKDIDDGEFIFYTNYGSAKSAEILISGKVAFVIHWKSLRRQVRVRGFVTKEDGALADKYFRSRSLNSRVGAWASEQSKPIASREKLLKNVEAYSLKLGSNPKRPNFWGGFRVNPIEIEFWADGEFRLHDRFRWSRKSVNSEWNQIRLQP